MAAVVALSAGLTTGLAAPHAGGEVTAGTPAQTTPPPPATTPPSDHPTTDPPATDPPATPPGEPPDTGPTTSPPSRTPEPDNSPGDEESSAPDGDEQSADGTVEAQRQEVEAVTAELSRVAADAPEELGPSVAELTGILRQTEAPETPPQEREGVIETARELTAALEAINDPRIPEDAREGLISAVKQVVATLDVAGEPSVPSEQRAATVLTVRRSASVLELIGDRTTSKALRKHLINSVRQTNSALMMSHEAKTPANSASPQGFQATARIGVALATAGESETSDGRRNGLAGATDEASRSSKDANDPRMSEEDRAEARKELAKQLKRLKELLEDEAMARGLPDAPLGEAAEVCTNAVFESVSDQILAGKLKQLSPPPWEDTGVKDYWKSERSGDDSLDVHAQLRNNQHDDALFRVARLITRLAEDVVPARDLIPTVGTPGLHCLQSARQLDRQGVETATWLELAQAVEKS
ncbi:hypothetical protein N4P33_32450 [Streptomyces sp. 15-116A]|uniref:hypothetical protein n=1 Tax=Streptomyces sp. 15-116A TaxID=2259035 RepID=UPI0021B39A24|nr:hypothetical protein [Streptomyces sp. 15-116A]MCT7356818.1 hypothetical protein [Streptomyces sp. 15-116A]